MATDKEIEAVTKAIQKAATNWGIGHIFYEPYEGGNANRMAKAFAVDALTAAEQVSEPSAADMRAFGASDEACYRWPEDTDEAKALRAAFIDGAASCRPDQASASEPADTKSLKHAFLGLLHEVVDKAWGRALENVSVPSSEITNEIIEEAIAGHNAYAPDRLYVAACEQVRESEWHKSTLARSDEIERDFYHLKAQEWACEPDG